MKNKVLLLWISVFVTQFFYANAEYSIDDDSKLSIELEEMGHMLGDSSPAPDSYMIYNIIAQGFPKNTPLYLSVHTWNASNYKYGLYALFIDDNGRLMNLQTYENGSPAVSTPFYLVIRNPAYAEQIDCSISIMGQVKEARIRIIPFPVESRVSNQRISLSASNSEERIYSIKGTGFKLFKEITVDLFESWNYEKPYKSFKTFADHNGNFFVDNLNLPKNRFFKIRVTDVYGCEIYIDYFKAYPSKRDWHEKPEEKVNYSVSLKTMNKEHPLYALKGAGFEPNQLLTIYILTNEILSQQYEIHADLDGAFFEYLPEIDYENSEIRVANDSEIIFSYSFEFKGPKYW